MLGECPGHLRRPLPPHLRRLKCLVLLRHYHSQLQHAGPGSLRHGAGRRRQHQPFPATESFPSHCLRDLTPITSHRPACMKATVLLLLLSALWGQAAIILSSRRTVSAQAAAYSCQDDTLGIPLPGGGNDREITPVAPGPFTQFHHAGIPGPALYGSGAAGQASFIGADAILIPSLYAEVYSGGGCPYWWSYEGENTATASLNVSFRLLQPAVYSFTGRAASQHSDPLRAYLSGDSVREQFELNRWGQPFSYSGTLQPGDYTLDITVHNYFPALGSGVVGELISCSRLENVAFTLTTVPEPTTALLLALLAGFGFLRRRDRRGLTV